MYRKTIFSFMLVALLFCNCNKESINSSSDKITVTDSLVFGDTKFLANGLEGKMYLIAPGTSEIPLFDTMKSVNTIYADSINIPERSWSSGFPGLPDRFEWFGIEYNGNIKALKQGQYTFTLVSDDGSKLFIDDSLLIDNDGLHSVASKTGDIELDSSQHKIKIQYIQGPRWSIALQLFAKMNNEDEQIFPGKYFQLTAPKQNFLNRNRLYIAIGAALLFFVLFVYKIANQKSKQD
jgi:hypothetical protein